MGAAGRDFHNFNMVFRNDPQYEVTAFTAAQIPFIERRIYPAGLAGPLYPEGIPIYPEEKLEELITRNKVEQVVFAYSDVTHEYVMHRASLCLALGADYLLLGPGKTMLKSRRPVISVSAVRTGCGKSGVTRYVLGILRSRGMKAVAIRHPMPYCDLTKSSVQRFATDDDLERYSCTIEEREEYEPIIGSGGIVYSGVDYEKILMQAEEESEIIVWDGGNNDVPFLQPGLEIVVFDPHRAGHETAYHPGETNLRRADVAVINKIDTAGREKIEAVEANIRGVNPTALIVHTASRIIADDPLAIKGKKVLVVEDGPTLTHGGMSFGAGLVAAAKLGAGDVIDPRPYAAGSLKAVYEKYPQIGPLLPAMGYAPEQIGELKRTIEGTPCDCVLIATPIDMRGLLDLSKDVVRINYEIEETDGKELKGCIEGFVDSMTNW